MNKWQVHTYEVWGNAKDGYEVNDVFRFGVVEFAENATDKDIMQALKSIGLLKKTVRLSQLEFDNSVMDDQYIAINEKKHSKPFCELRRIGS